MRFNNGKRKKTNCAVWKSMVNSTGRCCLSNNVRVTRTRKQISTDERNKVQNWRLVGHSKTIKNNNYYALKSSSLIKLHSFMYSTKIWLEVMRYVWTYAFSNGPIPCRNMDKRDIWRASRQCASSSVSLSLRKWWKNSDKCDTDTAFLPCVWRCASSTDQTPGTSTDKSDTCTAFHLCV